MHKPVANRVQVQAVRQQRRTRPVRHLLQRAEDVHHRQPHLPPNVLHDICTVQTRRDKAKQTRSSHSACSCRHHPPHSAWERVCTRADLYCSVQGPEARILSKGNHPVADSPAYACVAARLRSMRGGAAAGGGVISRMLATPCARKVLMAANRFILCSIAKKPEVVGLCQCGCQLTASCSAGGCDCALPSTERIADAGGCDSAAPAPRDCARCCGKERCAQTRVSGRRQCQPCWSPHQALGLG